MFHFDHRTNQCEIEFQRIIHLLNIANQLPNAFIDTKKVTKSHISTTNTPTWIDVLEGQLANEFKIRLKHGRPIGLKDITPRKRRTQRRIDTPEEVYDEQEALVEAYIEQNAFEEVRNKEIALKEVQVPENYEISINYVHNREKWDQNKVVINNIFSFQAALDIIRNDEDLKPQNVEEC